MKIYLLKYDGCFIDGKYWIAKESVSFDDEDSKDFYRVKDKFYETTQKEFERYFSFYQGIGGIIKGILSWLGIIKKPLLPKPLKKEEENEK